MTESTVAYSVLKKSAQDVRLLIAHVARQGHDLNNENLAALITAADKVGTQALQPDEEGKFWKLYADLVKLAQPAQVNSLYLEDYIRALGAGEVRPSGPDFSGIRKHQTDLRIIRYISIVSFVVTLAILAYISTAQTVITRTSELAREYSLLRQNVVTGTTIESTANAILSSRVQPRDIGGSAEDQPKDTGGSAEVQPKDSGGSAESPPNANLPALTAKQASVAGLIAARIDEIRSQLSINDRLLAGLQFRSPPTTSGPTPFNVPVVSTQSHINTILSNFILPTIASILGVTVFLLRNASTRIQDLSFRSNDAGVYWHRLVLGVVGGITVGWFTSVTKNDVFTSITPAALAFLVGYSVEVLYNILDSLVKALGGSKNP